MPLSQTEIDIALRAAREFTPQRAEVLTQFLLQLYGLRVEPESRRSPSACPPGLTTIDHHGRLVEWMRRVLADGYTLPSDLLPYVNQHPIMLVASWGLASAALLALRMVASGELDPHVTLPPRHYRGQHDPDMDETLCAKAIGGNENRMTAEEILATLPEGQIFAFFQQEFKLYNPDVDYDFLRTIPPEKYPFQLSVWEKDDGAPSPPVLLIQTARTLLPFFPSENLQAAAMGLEQLDTEFFYYLNAVGLSLGDFPIVITVPCFNGNNPDAEMNRRLRRHARSGSTTIGIAGRLDLNNPKLPTTIRAHEELSRACAPMNQNHPTAQRSRNLLAHLPIAHGDSQPNVVLHTQAVIQRVVTLGYAPTRVFTGQGSHIAEGVNSLVYRPG